MLLVCSFVLRFNEGYAAWFASHQCSDPGSNPFFFSPSPSRTSFFTFHNFFFESLLLGLRQKKRGKNSPYLGSLFIFLFFFSFLCAFHFDFRARRCKGSSSALHNAAGREGGRGKAHLGLWDSGRLVRCQSYGAKEK